VSKNYEPTYEGQLEKCQDERASLERTVEELSDEIKQLRADLMSYKYQDAELVRNLAMAQDERDEVRALYCKQLSPADPQKIAEKWRWDCFDNGKNAWLLPEKKQLLDKLVELEEKIEAHINNQKFKVTDGE
jgi:tRNA(Ile)-lysidine synthase TilS/MesJ